MHFFAKKRIFDVREQKNTEMSKSAVERIKGGIYILYVFGGTVRVWLYYQICIVGNV